MGYRNIQLNLRTDFVDDDIRRAIRRNFGLQDFTYMIEKKSLDARKKDNIHWQVGVVVSSPAFRGGESPAHPSLSIPFKKRSEKVVVVGSGPAGFFAGYVLQLSGYEVTIIERGSEVGRRSKAIESLEGEGHFSPGNNYAFGEGGAGTFSDGKLTSRSKHISAERRFFMEEYVRAGAPAEILYMAYPHVGTDNLKVVVPNLRRKFLDQGGHMLFDTMFEDLVVNGDRVTAVRSSAGDLEADHFLLATGHSAYDTYRMLMGRGVHFTTKNFAIGHRIEHPQKLINLAQWGRESLPGVKAAEYRLAMKTAKGAGVYTFCMCPGGYVVPSAAYEGRNVVNGMSYYRRDGDYANAGIVAGVHPDMLAGDHCSPTEILDWMDRMEESFYDFSGGLAVPATRVSDYLGSKPSPDSLEGSYSRGLHPAGLRGMVPAFIADAIAEGLRDFAGRIKGFDQGILMGLESKTSSPLQAVRESNGRCAGFDNLYIIGEGSGFAGGIVSSAADGIRCAMAVAGN